jgi:hypothetical protein
VLAVASSGLASEFFTGSWEARIALAPQQTQPFTAFESTLDVGLSIGFLKLDSISDFVIDGWIWEELKLLADVGAVSFEGHMLYDPPTGAMLYAEGLLSLCACPLTVSLHGALTGATPVGPANYGFVLDVRGNVNNVFMFESATYLGADLSGISFTASGSASDSTLLTKTFLTDPTIDPATAVFSGEDLTFTGNFLGCIALTSLTSFSADGFESERVTAEFRNLFGTPLMFALDLIYEVQTKSYMFAPSMASDFGCLSLYSSIASTDGVIAGLKLYGVKFAATIGAATLESISNLDTGAYVITVPEFGSTVELLADAIAEGHMYYDQDYWEVLSLTVGIPPLGAGFSFSVQMFFSTTDGLLFDWAKSIMGLTFSLGTAASTSTSITVDSSGFTGWALSFRVNW